MTTDLDAIERRHRQEVRGVNCRECRVSWPCDASVLLSLLREARALSDAMLVRIDNLEEAGTIEFERADAAEAELREARAERDAADGVIHQWQRSYESMRAALAESDASLTAIRERAQGLLDMPESHGMSEGAYDAARFILGAAPSPERDAVLVQTHPPRWVDQDGEWHDGIAPSPEPPPEAT